MGGKKGMNETYDAYKVAPPCYRGETDKCHLCPFEDECNPMEDDDVLYVPFDPDMQ